MVEVPKQEFKGPRCTYKETRFLGAGGFGAAYLTEKEDCDEKFVIKTHFHKKDMNLYQNAKDEAAKLARFNHPNLAKFVESFDIKERDGNTTHVIVLEFCNGGDLDAYIRAYGGMQENLNTYIDIFVQIWAGVKSLHEQGLVHSDLKPANVFLHRDGRTGPLIAKVGDFGVANWLPDGEQSILVGGAGTWPYMAPERLTRAKYGKRSDIWALGTIFFEMIAKRMAFKRKEDITSEKPGIENLPAWVPEELKAFLFKLLSKDKMLRPNELPSNKMTKTYPSNGATYQGTSRLWTGQRHGQGVMTYPDGQFYIGFFSSD